MKVILQKDVRNLGKIGDVVNVKDGYARNYLFPFQFASAASEDKIKQWEHFKRVAEAKKKNEMESKKEIAHKLTGFTLTFKAQASESDKLFGSISTHDISEKLSLEGYSVDKKDIQLEESIKLLGQHKAILHLTQGVTAEITISVERLA